MQLREALALLPAAPRLERIHLLVDLGAALRRTNQRKEAPTPCVRRSPWHRQEARRRWRSARAQLLFLTVKTVDYHLGNTYRKLGINRRSQLARALTGPAAETPVPRTSR